MPQALPAALFQTVRLCSTCVVGSVSHRGPSGQETERRRCPRGRMRGPPGSSPVGRSLAPLPMWLAASANAEQGSQLAFVWPAAGSSLPGHGGPKGPGLLPGHPGRWRGEIKPRRPGGSGSRPAGLRPGGAGGSCRRHRGGQQGRDAGADGRNQRRHQKQPDHMDPPAPEARFFCSRAEDAVYITRQSSLQAVPRRKGNGQGARRPDTAKAAGMPAAFRREHTQNIPLLLRNFWMASYAK